ncbi:MAG: sulfite exporter TauE/SafE family protein [Desulfobacterales bacterium]|nr:sulfite exporter TauE/SafE family protein [Desulfobacterales bacterium]
MFGETISYNAAFIAGLLSFFSPCILPLIPAYFTFITGLSIDELTESAKETRRKVILSTLVYVSGFSFVFIIMGASASFFGNLMFEYSWVVRYLGGTIIIIFSFHLLGIINIKGLNFEKRFHVKEKPLHLMGVFVIGMAFGAGWSPCIGPILGSILIVASNQDTILNGMLLLAIYSLGIAIPFILISIFITRMVETIKRATKYIMYINKTTGVLLFIVGVLLITDKFKLLGSI